MGNGEAGRDTERARSRGVTLNYFLLYAEGAASGKESLLDSKRFRKTACHKMEMTPHIGRNRCSVEEGNAELMGLWSCCS